MIWDKNALPFLRVFFRVLSFFPRFILFSAFYPFFRVLSLFPRFILFSAFYPFFRVLSLFPRFIPFSASAIPYFRNSGSVFYPNPNHSILIDFAIHKHHTSVLLFELISMQFPANTLLSNVVMPIIETIGYHYTVC